MKTIKTTNYIIAIVIISLTILLFPIHELQAVGVVFSTNKSSVSVGENITVTIKITAPTLGYTSYGLTVKYDPNAFTYVSYKNNSGISSPTVVHNNPYVIVDASNDINASYNGTGVGAITFRAKTATSKATFTLVDLSIGEETDPDGKSASVKVIEKAAATPTPKPTAAPTAKPTAAPTAKPTAAPTPKPTGETTAKATTRVEEETTADSSLDITETTIIETSPPERIFSFVGLSLKKAGTEPEEEDIPQGFLLLTDEAPEEPATYVLPGSDLTLFWLENENGEANFYFFDIDQDVYVPYREISYPQGVFRIALPTKNDSVPEGFVESSLILSDKEYPAFRPDPDRDLPAGIVRIPEQIYLLYLQRDVEAEEGGIETEGGFYYYDQISAAIFPYDYLPLVIPEALTPEPTNPTEPVEGHTNGSEPQMTANSDGSDAEIAALTNVKDGFRIFSMILAALLLGSWLLFWALAPGRKRAKAGANKDNEIDEIYSQKNSDTDIYQTLPVEDTIGLHNSQSTQNQELYKSPDEETYDSFAKADYPDSTAGNNVGQMPWYVEEEKPAKFSFRKSNTKDAQQPDSSPVAANGSRNYPEEEEYSVYKRNDGIVNVSATDDSENYETDPASEIGGFNETNFDEGYNDSDGKYTGAVSLDTKETGTVFDERYNNPDGKDSVEVSPDTYKARNRYSNFRRKQSSDRADNGSLEPNETEDPEDIFGDRGEI